MRLVIQRVKKASLKIENIEKACIAEGLLIFVGIEEADGVDDIDYLTTKILNLRIFEDEEKKMNLSLLDIKGELLLVSQFTLFASTKKGNRPSFIKAAKPEKAKQLYNDFILACKACLGKKVQTGVFGANMQINLENSGPVTIILDSRNKE